MRQPVYLGQVWMNGDPFLVADWQDAESWDGFHGDYERVLALANDHAGQIEVEVGSRRGLVLDSDYDDGTLEVFRVGDNALLFVGVRYADSIDYARFVADALALELESVGAMEITSGELAILAAAAPWHGSPIVREQARPYPTEWGGPSEDILLVMAPSGHHEMLGAEVDREAYGLAVWRLTRASGE
jgi:hypothetical protein